MRKQTHIFFIFLVLCSSYAIASTTISGTVNYEKGTIQNTVLLMYRLIFTLVLREVNISLFNNDSSVALASGTTGPDGTVLSDNARQ